MLSPKKKICPKIFFGSKKIVSPLTLFGPKKKFSKKCVQNVWVRRKNFGPKTFLVYKKNKFLVRNKSLAKENCSA